MTPPWAVCVHSALHCNGCLVAFITPFNSRAAAISALKRMTAEGGQGLFATAAATARAAQRPASSIRPAIEMLRRLTSAYCCTKRSSRGYVVEFALRELRSLLS